VIEVENAMFLNLQTMGRLFQTEEILPKQGPLREELVSYVDDYPFTEFVSDRISNELLLRDKYQAEARNKLVDIDGYGDVDALASGRNTSKSLERSIECDLK
jgi:hypothetical protein